ncbi:MAG: hypothetical protein AAGC65_05730 [Mucilaginibacter sp.]|uniref:hypothetical protein n=1 Tax=Mucilaginibacter sp. TaxID=1882438 RepID=UPI0031B538E4
MEQLALFAHAGQTKGLPEDFLAYSPGLCNQQESDLLLQKFTAEPPGTKLYKSCMIKR